MRAVLQDVRYAVRGFRQSPAFALVAVATLALAVGSTTAVVSLTRAALVKSLPYAEPENLVHLWMTDPNGRHEFAYPDYLDARRDTRAFADIGGYAGGLKGVLQLPSESVPVRAASASASFFSTLGIVPAVGRTFEAADERPNAPRSVVLGYRLWRERFAGDPSVVGRSLVLNGSPRRIAGVLPAAFNFAPALGAEIWINLRIDDDRMRRNLWWFNLVARVKPEIGPKKARDDLARVFGDLAQRFPDSHTGTGVQVVPLADQILGPVRNVLTALLGAVGAVLLIACANIAGLLLGRATARRREIAIRAALGASARRLVAQLFTESLLLAGIGGAAGVLFSVAIVRGLIAAIPEAQAAAMPYLEHARLDGSVLLAGLAATIAAGLLFGLAPSYQIARATGADPLRETHASEGRQSHRMRSALVTGEIAIAIVLLAGAGVMIRSTLALLRVDPGFETRNLLTLQVALPPSPRYEGRDRLAAFHAELLSRVRAVPGVRAAGTVDVLPLSGGGNTVNFAIEGTPVLPGHENEANIRSISTDYFRDMGIPLITGRPFGPEDRDGGPKTVIVNRSLARRFFGGANPVGKKVRFTFNDRQPYREIVGGVGDENQKSLDEEPAPVIYASYLQSLDDSMSVVIRASGDPERLGPSVKAAILAIDPAIMVVDVTTMGQMISDAPSTFLRRYPALLIGGFAAVALLLAAIGLYGIMTFAVARRSREIGIRLALGAQRREVVGMVLSSGGRVVAAGLALGLAGAVATTRVLSSILFRVRPLDPVSLALVSILLAAVALLACWLPARRAAGVDPASALRNE